MVIKTWQNMAKHGKTWDMGNYETDWTISHEQKKLTLTLRIRFDRPLRSRRLGRAWNWSSTWFSAQLLASKISGADVSPEILVSRVYKLDTVSCRCKGKLAFKSLSLTHIWIYIYTYIYVVHVQWCSFETIQFLGMSSHGLCHIDKNCIYVYPLVH